jgi:hypothetical protein
MGRPEHRMAELLLHGPRQVRQSFERQVLRSLPAANVVGSIAPLVVYCAFAPAIDADAREALGIALYMTVGFMVATWFSTLAVAITCVIVALMKGPARVADAYPLHDGARPLR